MEAKHLPNPAEEISQFHIRATASIPERWPRTLKHGDTFALFDQLADIVDPELSPGGLFHQDMRHLSRQELRINGQRPLLLSSAIEDDNVVMRTDLSNPDVYLGDQIVLPRETLHVRRSTFLFDSSCYQRIAVHNFDVTPHKCFLTIAIDADFKDMFEIRGIARTRRGVIHVERPASNALLFLYAGLDKLERCTHVVFDPAPHSFDAQTALFILELNPHEQISIFATASCKRCDLVMPFSKPYRAAKRAACTTPRSSAGVSCVPALPAQMFHRADADLRMLVTQTPHGPYPYAGTPWFNTTFGRDGIITALQMLWLDPSLARGVLQFLAATQATETDAATDAQPGKILHEARSSEMANCGEVPFGRYYGSVDATPLFILLGARYFARTGDIETIRKLWPNFEAALGWIETYGDVDGDGFIEYLSESSNGLRNQGWKDSNDSISHADGSLAEGAIALCEVQGYVYAARRGMAQLARVLDNETLAVRMDAAADSLRERFEEKFWCEELGVYALALDGEKQPCRVRSSNAGQVLLSGIASPERARQVADTLLAPSCFSGYGIRTLGARAARYNPIAYHNGSIWPHDNALIASGFAHYGLRDASNLLFGAIYDAARHMELMRLPELFCGFPRRRATAPTLYPVACTPQAWACVAPYAFLEASLGISCDALRNEIRFDHPVLPNFIGAIKISNLRLGAESHDFHIRNTATGTQVTAVHASEKVRINVF